MLFCVCLQLLAKHWSGAAPAKPRPQSDPHTSPWSCRNEPSAFPSVSVMKPSDLRHQSNVRRNLSAAVRFLPDVWSFNFPIKSIISSWQRILNRLNFDSMISRLFIAAAGIFLLHLQYLICRRDCVIKMDVATEISPVSFCTAKMRPRFFYFLVDILVF